MAATSAALSPRWRLAKESLGFASSLCEDMREKGRADAFARNRVLAKATPLFDSLANMR